MAAPIVFDMDPGIDDALALQYLLGRGDWDLQAITTVAGNVSVDATFRNARGLARLFGIASDVPVYRGCARPLVRPPIKTDVHGPTGLADLDLPPALDVPEPATDAVDALLRLSHQHAGELTVIATGPLTNVALAVVRDPGFANRVDRLVFMGGAARVPGNATPTAEYNILFDPEAAEVVVASDLDWTMVGLDVTHQAAVTRDHLERLATLGDKTAFACHLLEYYGRVNRNGLRCYLHDPLAVGVASAPDFVELQRGAVVVETASPVTVGQTVFYPDGVGVPEITGGETRATGHVALALGSTDYVEDFLGVLPQWPAQEPLPKGGESQP